VFYLFFIFKAHWNVSCNFCSVSWFVYVVLSFALCGKRSIAVISCCLFVPLCTLPATLKKWDANPFWSLDLALLILVSLFVCLSVCCGLYLLGSLKMWGKPSDWNYTQPKMKGNIMSKQTIEETDGNNRVTKKLNLKNEPYHCV